MKLFRKKQYNSTSSTLTSIRSIVGLPKREEFSNDLQALQLIEQYKKEYSKTLRLNKTIVSIDLMPKELHEYKNIYLSLLTNLCIDDNNDMQFEKINANNYKSLNIMVKKLKLDLYINEVMTMEKEAKLRIIALTEILGTTFFFSKNKKRAINDEIDNLSFARATFENQKLAMEREKTIYLNKLKNLKYEDFQNAEDEQERVNEYLNELIEIANLVLPEKLEELKKINLSPKLLIAKLEQLLEIYVYTHQNTLDTLSREVEEIADFISKNPSLSSRQIFKYLQKIKEIEMFFKIFSKYGRNIVAKTNLENLYQVKFNLLTYNIYDKEFNILNNITFIELECYKNIISKKIEQILKGNNIYVIDLATKSDLKTVINYIKDVLKFDKNKFSPDSILKNGRVLRFLLAFDKYNGLEDFFKKEKELKQRYNSLNYYDYFEWEYILPLDTIFRIMRCNIETEPNNDKTKLSSLYYLHQLQKDLNPSEDYILPEGLVSINVYTICNRVPKLYSYIRSLAENKRVKMPISLRHFSGKLFQNTRIISLELNEGLREIDSYALETDNMSELTIPSTLYKNEDFFKNLPKTLKKVTINNYSVNNNLDNLIRQIACNHYLSVHTNVTYLIPTIDSLVFLDEDGQIAFTLTKEELILNKGHSIPTIKDASIIYEYIKSKIEEKTKKL